MTIRENLRVKQMEYFDSKKQKIKMAAGMFYWSLVLTILLAGQSRMIRGTGSMRTRQVILFFCIILIVAVSAGFSLFRSMKKTKNRQKTQRGKIWQYLFLFADAVFVFLEIEYINNPILSDMQIGYMALNVVIIFGLLLSLCVLLNSFKAALLIWNIFYYIISLVFYYVYLFRGEPFQFIDIYSIWTAAEVAAGYTFTVSREIIIFTVLTLCVLPLIFQSRNYCVAKKKIWRIIPRGITVGFLVLMYFLYLNTGWNGGVGIMTDLYRPYKTYKEYGTTTGFLCVAKYMRVTPPEGYSVEEAKKIAENSRRQNSSGNAFSADTAEAATAGIENKITLDNPLGIELTVPPADMKSAVSTGIMDGGSSTVQPVNIIAIMNESWADYRYIGDFETTQPYMEYYDSLQDNIIKGHTLVCIRGGGTAKTEYEFLTGNSVKRFPGMVPYVSYFTHDQYSLVTTLEAQGYESAAMHPNKGSNWKRTSAYRLLNFDNFYTIDDFDSTDLRIRQHISDQANYEKIIEVINEKENPEDPFFMFDVTMQNHGGYTADDYSADVETVGYTDRAVNQYLSLMQDTDEALQYLIEYFKDYDQPTMIVMFGDHYPDLPEEFTEWLTGKTFDDSTLAEQQRYYATPFFIWANYDIPEADNILTSTNFLSSIMLSQTGLVQTDYNEYLTDLMAEMPALNHLGYMNSEGDFTSWDNADKTYEKLEQNYEILQYNELTEDSDRLDSFFLPNMK